MKNVSGKIRGSKGEKMDLKTVKELCMGLGEVETFKENPEFFGNMELMIRTPKQTGLCIVSDRGEFLCYVQKELLFAKKQISLSQILEAEDSVCFASLEEAINYLKAHIQVIEKQ
ncbi:MAG: hypothetical protein IJ036_00325 [Lachnospiraceae bacterium]|nr:hypothetical protein [Lachnospiraceae bacterium]